MVRTFLSRLARVRITAAYAVILVCVTTTLSALGPAAQDRAIRHASTNLDNLSHWRVATLFESAFVVDAGPIYEWLPGLVCLLGLAELLWGSVRLVIAFAVGHIGATLLVAVWLTAAVEVAWLPAEVSRAADVGMSYGAVGVLGALTSAIDRAWRPMWPVGYWRWRSSSWRSARTSPTPATPLPWCWACGWRPDSADRSAGRGPGCSCCSSRRRSATWC